MGSVAMADEVSSRDYLQHIIARVPGLHAIDVSLGSHALEGKELLRVTDTEGEHGFDGGYNAFRIMDQASKLGMGKSRTITSFYDNLVVVHVKHDPLLTSFFADKDADVGLLHNIVDEVREALEPLRLHVERVPPVQD